MIGKDRKRFRVILLLALLLLAGAVVGAGAVYLLGQSERPFPQASEVERITARVDERGKSITFQVPRSHWDAIFSALLPARRDDHPAKWEVLGNLNLKLENKGSFYIELYLVQKDPGAFSAGPTQESRVYYRGGKTADLEKAITEALKASAEKKQLWPRPEKQKGGKRPARG